MIGATLCKGLNRGLGTLAAGSLAFLMEFIATEYGRVFRAIFIGAAVFVIGKYHSKELMYIDQYYRNHFIVTRSS